MGGFVSLTVLIGTVLFPFVAMPLLWRRMKRVRDGAYEESAPQRREPTWQEPLATRDGLNLVHTHDPNEELIGLGDKARHSHWPLNNP
ncbi:MAG: hypothetical protein JWN66_2957 [Sphingomonas bacterium]|jgi:hypothetical protein|uniref:hypothetical protein n=1 Tax=Sphingomonas bacterium TaxID=1895847 RepID=UPI0026270B76|nr:hypothetical protein [Sphingomonas bacterium]MDB5705841.1 hypothetical protein [Sphingomonas bacterium]